MAAGVVRKLNLLLQSVDTSNIDEWFVKHERDIVEMIHTGWQSNRTLAAIYLRDHAAANRTFTTVHQALFSRDRVRTSVLVTGPIKFKQAISAGGSPAAALRLMRKALAGAAYRHTANGSRDTVMNTVRNSRTILGYRRISDGDPCAFCAMLVSRGAVYTKETAKFEAHDKDGCVPEPEYRPKGSFTETGEAARLFEIWKESGAQDLTGRAAIAAFRAALKTQ